MKIRTFLMRASSSADIVGFQFVELRRGVASCPDYSSRSWFRQGERFEQLFEEIFSKKIFLLSAGRGARNSRTKSRTRCLHSGSASPSASRRCISLATATRRSVRYSRWSMSCAAISAADFNAGWSSPVARKAHNLEAVSSNLTPATNFRRAI